MIYRFETPNWSFEGERAGVQFHSGHGETTSQLAANDLLAMGYTLVETIPDAERADEPAAPAEPDPEPDEPVLIVPDISDAPTDVIATPPPGSKRKRKS